MEQPKDGMDFASRALLKGPEPTREQRALLHMRIKMTTSDHPPRTSPNAIAKQILGRLTL